MKKKDRLKFWEPVENLIGKTIYVEAIIKDYEGFRILLKGEDINSKILNVTFDEDILYRVADVAYLDKIWVNMSDNIKNNVFYIVENSSYIDYFHDMSLNCYSNWIITHYAIYTSNSCIDVLSLKIPDIRWLN